MSSWIGNALLKQSKKIVGVARNYAPKASDQAAKSASSDPIVFLKPSTSLLREGEPVQIPKGIGRVAHEVELGVVISDTAKDVNKEDWQKHVAGYVLAIDMTAVDLQAKAREKGLPWTIGKSFDTFCPVSEVIEAKNLPDWDKVEMWLKVDDELRQSGVSGDMIHSVPFLIEYISSIMTLEMGDIILTGTPAGVGPVEPGQVMHAGLKDLIDVEFEVVWKE